MSNIVRSCNIRINKNSYTYWNDIRYNTISVYSNYIKINDIIYYCLKESETETETESEYDIYDDLTDYKIHYGMYIEKCLCGCICSMCYENISYHDNNRILQCSTKDIDKNIFEKMEKIECLSIIAHNNDITFKCENFYFDTKITSMKHLTLSVDCGDFTNFKFPDSIQKLKLYDCNIEKFICKLPKKIKMLNLSKNDMLYIKLQNDESLKDMRLDGNYKKLKMKKLKTKNILDEIYDIKVKNKKTFHKLYFYDKDFLNKKYNFDD